MSAALVEIVREAERLENVPGGAAWHEADLARASLDLSVILAALTEAEALRAQVAARAVNATIDHFGVDTLDIPCLATERGTGCLGRTQDEVNACVKRDREALVQAVIDRVLGGS